MRFRVRIESLFRLTSSMNVYIFILHYYLQIQKLIQKHDGSLNPGRLEVMLSQTAEGQYKPVSFTSVLITIKFYFQLFNSLKMAAT